MSKKIELLDCTLRDGAYIVDSKFGTTAIKGIIKRLQDADIDIIECGWLKDAPHEEGSSFYHIPADLEPYLLNRKDGIRYVAMIDWDRYDLNQLPPCGNQALNTIRVVFPHGKYHEGIAVGRQIAEKGYQVFFQAANTLAYSNKELEDLSAEINRAKPVSLSIVDTFGAMYGEDLERIINVLDEKLDSGIKLGFHSHNNQQLSFSLTMHFVEKLRPSRRSCVVDASLCGMGRGAGNATTELVASYLNRKHHCDYDMNQILGAIDTYMTYFQENYSWGYSTPYFIAGMYCCHVNNISYLLKNHRTNAQDMYNIIESLSPEDRLKYDYDLLEEKYIQNQDRKVNDDVVIEKLRKELAGRKLLLIAPGESTVTEADKVKSHIEKENPIIIGVNAANPLYKFDYLFLISKVRYDYVREIYPEQFYNSKRILLSSIKATEDAEDNNEYVINFGDIVKTGWEHFDNAVIYCLRLLDHLGMTEVSIAGFDEFGENYNESYADKSLPTLSPEGRGNELNQEICDLYEDFKRTSTSGMKIKFVTKSGVLI